MHIKINNRSIGSAFSPFVIAEMSANHNGTIQSAFDIIKEAKKAGADAVKLQTYRPDTITLNSDREDFQIKSGLWKGKTLYQLYEQAHTPWEWHAPLFEFACEQDITIFSSPFDNSAVDLLENLNAPAYKIASFEAVDLPLIRYAASTGKPLIISTGMANREEIAEAVNAAREAGCEQLAVLHCVSGYPASPKDYNLKTIPDMAKRFGTIVGLSDHTLDNTSAIASIALGATIIEKHLTLDRTDGGPDDSFSLEPAEMAALCRDTKSAWEAVGDVDYGIKSSEKGNVKFRRSLYFVQNLSAGDVITKESVRSVRPGFGAAPKHFHHIIGKKVTKEVYKNSPVLLRDIE